MAFRFEHREPIPKGAQRIAKECLDKATAALDTGDVSSDTDIHDARKQFKKLRTVVRLMHTELGSSAFKRENRAVRDAARPLSAVRDAKVLIERFDALNDSFGGRASADCVAEFRAELAARRRAVRNRTIGDPDVLPAIRRQIRDVRKRSKRWPLRRHGWKSIEGGLRRIYKQGRAAMRNGRMRPTDDALHEWRKRAKDLRYVLELLRHVRPSMMKGLAQQAHQLTDLLGEDHDLAVMRGVVREVSRRHARTGADALTALIYKRRSTLQVSAFALGRTVYHLKTDAFLRRLKHCWKRTYRAA